MFKKPPNVKNLSVLRSSDRKKIIQQIVHTFSLENIDLETRNALLPDGAQVRRSLVGFGSRLIRSRFSLPSLRLIYTSQECCITTRKASNLCGLRLYLLQNAMRC